MVILVEGPSDKMILEEFFAKAEIYSRYDVKIWALGGGIMNKHDLEIFAATYKVKALLDNDPEEDRGEFERNCQRLQIPIFKLSRYVIENYFTIEALRNVFGDRISKGSDIKIDPNTKLTSQGLGEFNPKRSEVPRRIARSMNLEDIKGTDLYEFVVNVAKDLSSDSA